MDVQEIMGQCGDLIDQATALAKNNLGAALQKFLEEHPDIEAIGWLQFTPHFNDGDTCEFSMNDISYKPKYAEGDPNAEEESDVWGFNEEDGWLEGYYWEEGKCGLVSKKSFDDLKSLSKSLHKSEDMMKAVFGDHVKVTVTRDGVDVDEHKHD